MKKLHVIGYCLLLYIANCYAQNTENKDSVRLEKDSDNIIFPVEIKDLLSPDRDLSIDKVPFKKQSGFIQPVMPAIQLTGQEGIKRNLPFFTPYSYSFDSFIEGATVKGFYGSNAFTDYLAANINIYLSKTYFGNAVPPYFYLNGSVRTELILKLHNRVQLTGMGQISLREGLDPKIPSIMGGANYYGAGIQFKITNKVGIGVGFTNNYYRGEWTKRTYMVPVGY